ncbi:hypothetical protein CVE18_12240 [Escherichia coli]|nr:hypothetical protein CVE18_12240 [Escherichia coli]
MDEQWGYVGAKSRQRWLFYAYDRIRRTVVAHVFGEPRQPGGCKLKTAPVRPVVAARPAEYVCSEDLFY